MEGMAYPLYRYEIKYWSRFDPGLSKTIQGAFADEAHHVTFGEAVNSDHVRKVGIDERNRLLRLTKDFGQLMTSVFDEVIDHYIGLYQECANQYSELVGDIEIFPGKKLGQLSEEDQARIVQKEIQDEHRRRLERIGLC
jgi:hypothetical protein